MTHGASTTSIIVCAYTEDRWDDILNAVSSLREQTRPPDQIIMVVDHNRALFDRACATMADITLIENSGARGLSGARNSGIAAARGALIGFLDDDAAAAPDWLELLVAACADERVLGAGGWVAPRWLCDRPAWFPDEFLWTVGCSYRGQPGTLTEVRNLFGGCMLVRRDVFDAIGTFTNGIGRVGKRPTGCEETELCIRARRQRPDGRWMFEPRARIAHCVSQGRVSWRYFRARCYAEGLSKAIVARNTSAGEALATERTYTLQTLPQGVLRGLDDALHGDIGGITRAAAIIAGLVITLAGYIVGGTAQLWARQPLHQPGSVIQKETLI
jgi:glucosyl-dolichyl phosphate glucuronosyltransferase